MFPQLLFTFLLWQSPSFIEQSIASAQDMIAKEPDKAQGYSDYAMALIRKERETGNASFLQQAEQAIQKSLKIDPANFEARRSRVALRLSQHRYEDALEEAEALRKQRPDDNPVYAFISQADLALGKYLDAENAVQRMLDLRSVNSPGYEAGALVREVIGYPDGAIEWWNSALHLVSDRDHEERAYILSQMARVYRETGKYALGVDSAQQALQLEPGHPMALFELARIRLDQQQPKAAAELLESRLKEGSDLESLYWLAVAQSPGAGAEFEKQARAAIGSPLNANALLVRYLADHGKATEAIAIAEDSLRRRPDLFTRYSYAVSLDRAARAPEALQQIQKAMQPGLLDANLYYQAGMIAEENHDIDLAKVYLRKAFEINTASPISGQVLKQLGLFEKPPAN